MRAGKQLRRHIAEERRRRDCLDWRGSEPYRPIYVEGSDTDRLQVYFGIYNDGASAVSPNVESSHLYVNGVEPKDWSLVISNGIRNELFSSLPPGQTLQFTYLTVLPLRHNARCVIFVVENKPLFHFAVAFRTLIVRFHHLHPEPIISESGR